MYSCTIFILYTNLKQAQAQDVACISAYDVEGHMTWLCNHFFCFQSTPTQVPPVNACMHAAVRVQAWLCLIRPMYRLDYTTRTSQMEHHVLSWTGLSSEDHTSVSNVSTQSLVRLPMYRMSHHHNIHPDASQAYWPNPMADYHRIHPLQVMHDHPDFMTDLGSCLCT